MWHVSPAYEHYFSARDLITRDRWYHSGHTGLLSWTVSFEFLSLQVRGRPELLSISFLPASLWYFLMLVSLVGLFVFCLCLVGLPFPLPCLPLLPQLFTQTTLFQCDLMLLYISVLLSRFFLRWIIWKWK